MPKVKAKATRLSKAELQKENDELKAALKEKLALDHASVEAGEMGSGPVMVPIKNFSPNYIVYDYQWRGLDRRLELSSKGRKQLASVPLEIWYELERDTALVNDGYIARIDKPITNPNIVEDTAAVVEKLTEDQFKDRVTKITNPFSLYELVGYLEPLTNKTSKQLMAQTTVRSRVKELLGTVIMDDLG